MLRGAAPPPAAGRGSDARAVCRGASRSRAFQARVVRDADGNDGVAARAVAGTRRETAASSTSGEGFAAHQQQRRRRDQAERQQQRERRLRYVPPRRARSRRHDGRAEAVTRRRIRVDDRKPVRKRVERRDVEAEAVRSAPCGAHERLLSTRSHEHRPRGTALKEPDGELRSRRGSHGDACGNDVAGARGADPDARLRSGVGAACAAAGTRRAQVSTAARRRWCEADTVSP